MGLHWCWSWGLGLPRTDYVNSAWAFSGVNVFTNDTSATHLESPAPGGLGPTDAYVMRLSSHTITSPAFPDGTLSQGWAVFRWHGNSTPLTVSAAVRILDLMNGAATAVVTVRSAAAGVGVPMALYVNGTLIGTTTNFYGNGTEKYGVDFDLTATPPQAGLVVNGVREIARAAGSGVPTTIDRIRWGSGASGGSNFTYHGALAIFDSLADLTDLETQDLRCSFLAATAITDGDASWTPTATTDLGDVTDHSSATGTESVSDPDTIGVAFQSFNDRFSGWAPTTIYGVAAISYNLGDATVNQHTVELLDDGGSVKTSAAATIATTGGFVGVWSPLNSSAAAWTSTNADAATANYTVT